METDKVLALAKQAANSFKTYAMEVTEYDFTDDSIQEFAALIQQQMEAEGWRQCAVGQGTTQFCGMAEELRKDAERYRYLRDNPFFQIEYTGDLTLDEHVDQARSANDT